MHKNKIVADNINSNIQPIRVDIYKCIYGILKKFINEALRFCVNTR